MKLKVLRVLFCLFFLFLTFSCGGAPQRKTEAPAVAREGAKAIQKGNRFYDRGCYGQAATQFLKAHAVFTAADDQPGVAISLNSLGNIYQADGDTDNAIAFFDEARTLYAELGDRQGVLQAQSNKAAALIGADRLEPAEALIEEALQGTAESFLPLQINRGILFIKKGAYPEAQAVLEKALAAADRQNHTARAKIHFSLGRLAHLQGNAPGAGEHFQQALDSDRAVGFYPGMAQDHTRLGDVYRETGAREKALSHYKRAVKIHALLEDGAAVKNVLEKLAETAEATGADIRITTHFAKTWLEDKSLKRPCR